VSTPADVLLAEVAEDHGSPDALSAEFDGIVAPVLHKFCDEPQAGGAQNRPSPPRRLRLAERMRRILVRLRSTADPLIFSPGFRLAVLFFAIVGIGIPTGVYWLSSEQPGTGIARDTATDGLPGRTRGLGGESGRDAHETAKGSDSHDGFGNDLKAERADMKQRAPRAARFQGGCRLGNEGNRAFFKITSPVSVSGARPQQIGSNRT
jgi:hypothetical protein